jgi:hypothetical protein
MFQQFSIDSIPGIRFDGFVLPVLIFSWEVLSSCGMVCGELILSYGGMVFLFYWFISF